MMGVIERVIPHQVMGLVATVVPPIAELMSIIKDEDKLRETMYGALAMLQEVVARDAEYNSARHSTSLAPTESVKELLAGDDQERQEHLDGSVVEDLSLRLSKDDDLYSGHETALQSREGSKRILHFHVSALQKVEEMEAPSE